MNNYEYIVASLPTLDQDPSTEAGNEANQKNLANQTDMLGWIRSQCSKKDNNLLDLLVEGFDENKLNKDFYQKMAAQRNTFLKEYYAFDLCVRNAKVRSINEALGRDSNKDIFLKDECPDDLAAALSSALSGSDILEKERAIDSLYWKKIESLTLMHYFDSTVLLGHVAKLHIIERWMKLDEATGRALFRSLVDGVRATFKGVEYNEQ